jgi:hypothetical protein
VGLLLALSTSYVDEDEDEEAEKAEEEVEGLEVEGAVELDS